MSPSGTIVAIFFLQALAFGGLFPRIPDIQAGLDLGEAGLGLVLAAQPVGGFLSFFVASGLIERVGTRPMLALSIPVMALTVWIAAATGSVAMAAGALGISGFAFTFSNLAMNVEADRYEVATGRLVMNRCHGLWGFGLLGASLIGVAARGLGVSDGVHLALIVPVAAAATAALIVPMRPFPARAHEGGASRMRLPMPTPAVLGIVGFGMMGGVLQGGVHNWSVIYMRDTFAAPDWVDALTIPAFLLTMSVARLYGDRWTNALGARRLSVVLIFVALAGTVVVALAPGLGAALAGFALMGIGIAVIFPVMVSAAAAIGDRPASENVSAVVMTTGAAMLVVPPVMGLAAETFGLRAAFALMIPAPLLSLACLRFVAPR